MGKNPVVAIIAVIILIVAIVLIAKNMSGDSGGVQRSGDGFWYDTGSKKLFGASSIEMPPIKAPSGSEGVLAYVFAKGSCDNASDRSIVYLEKYPDRDAIMKAASIEDRMPLLAKRLVRRENDADWVEASSEEGAAIIAEGTAARQSGKQCTEYKK